MKPSLLFFLLYFFEGAPIGLVWWAIPTLMANHGQTIDVITAMTAMAALPWTFKFLIGPVVDRYFFTLRSYALAVSFFQFLMLLSLLSMLFIPISDSRFIWVVLAVSFFSALQDVFIDAWAIGVVAEDQRGQVNGAMQVGLLTGRWLFGAGLLIALSFINWKLAIMFLVGTLSVSIIYLCARYFREAAVINSNDQPLSFRSFGFLLDHRTILLSVVAILTGFSFEAFGAVVGPFLLANGYEKEGVGFILSGNLLTMLIGAYWGGRQTDRFGSHKVFYISGFVICLLVVLLGVLHSRHSGWPLIFSSWITYFTVGVFIAASYSFYMTHSSGEMKATRFTFFMAMTNLCESLSAYSIGLVIAVPTLSYTGGFITASIIGLVGVFLLWKLFNPERQSPSRSV